MNIMFGTFPKCNVRINNGTGVCTGVLVPCAAPEYDNYTVWVCTRCSRTIDYEGRHKPIAEDKDEPKT